jgi:predicted nucleic acid-binding protein
MNAMHFVDTNLLVYARDASESAKQPLAEAWLKHLWATRTGRLSTQVLGEYFVTVTNKLKPGLPPDEAWDDVERLLVWKPQPLDVALLRKGRSLQARFGFSWWDALIVGAAHVSGCRFLLTEDLQDGQDLEGVTVVNPFLHPPDSPSR